MKKIIKRLSLAQIFMLVATAGILGLALSQAQAHDDPSGCFSNGVGLSIAVYRNDGTTPVAAGSVESGETIKYEATLSHLNGSNCNFEGGTLTITTPDGTPNVVASGAGIPLVISGSPFIAPQQSYVVSEGDVVGGFLSADVDYSGGTSHTPTQHQNASAGVDISTPFQDTALEVTKDANPSLTETFEWTIDKSVTPAVWDLFDGDRGTSEYTIALTKGEARESGFAVAGTITIHNPSQFADAVITSVADAVSGVGAMTVACPETLPFNLAPGADLVCTYSGALPDSATRTNTATVTTSGDVDGDSGDATVDFANAQVTTVNDEVNVDDTFAAGDAGPFSANAQYSYQRTFTCGADAGTHNNTATIVETQQSDSASVTVNCYDLMVEKTATTTYDRMWDWTIDKSADQTNLSLTGDEMMTVNYTVDVDATSADTNHMVSGNITITNNHPTKAADLTGVVDEVSVAIGATVNCPALTVPADGTLVCTYSTSLPDGANRTNTATATQQNYDYDPAGVATPTGTTAYSGNANVVFGAPTTVTDECIDVSDTNTGVLGTVCAGDAPETFNYSLSFGANPDADVVLVCGENTHPNTASFVTNDTEATGQDTWTVTATVECATGCTLTQGYWKTHSELGPAPYDDTWAQLADGADTELAGSGFSWYEVFWTTPKGGNVWYQLAHQWMAAYLNTLTGASTTSAVDTALADGADWLAANDPGDNIKGQDAADAQGWASTLASYNEGLIGPGHCDEELPS